MLTCFYGLQRLKGAKCSPEEKAKYGPLTCFALMALARKNILSMSRKHSLILCENYLSHAIFSTQVAVYVRRRRIQS